MKNLILRLISMPSSSCSPCLFGATLLPTSGLQIKPTNVLTSAIIFGMIMLTAVFLFHSARRSRVKMSAGVVRSWRSDILSVLWKPIISILLILSLYIALFPLVLGILDKEVQQVVFHWINSLVGFGIIGGCVWLIVGLVVVFERRVQNQSHEAHTTIYSLFLRLAIHAFNVGIPFFILITIIPLLKLRPAVEACMEKIIGVVLIIGIASVLIRAVSLFELVLLSRYQINNVDNLAARKLHTQASVIKKIVNTIVIVVALGCALMLFDPVRQLGTSILASAGIAGIILGFAAQKTLSNFFAGVQIAIAQPIRIDDVVVVENEFGRVEEIALTHVVVKLWDLRRIILPITYFLEKPFQNWTRTGSKILGTVFLYLDYAVPIDVLRAELRRIVEASSKWDSDVCKLEVTNASEQAIELRCLVSAHDANRCWDLRCEVREKMIIFIQTHYPNALPRNRTSVQMITE